MNNFDLLIEKESERFQTGGVMLGDVVKFRPDCLKMDYFENRAESFRNIIKSCMEPTFDLNLRVGAVRSIYPTTTQNYGNGTESPDGTFLDIYQEYAPGLFRLPMTVPIGAVEVFNSTDNTWNAPIPDSLRRKNKIHGPEEVKAEQPDQKNINLQNKNVVLPNSNKWDDTEPGGGNF